VNIEDIQELQGDLVALRYASPDAEMVEMFRRPRLLAMTGLQKAPNLKKLTDLIEEDDELVVWTVVPEGQNQAIGYACYVAFDGPPYVAVYTFSEEEEVEIAHDCIVQLAHLFFGSTKEEGLHFFRDRPVPEEIHDRLIEGGFDFVEDCPTIDNDVESCYVLERHTYEAYYGEQDEEDELPF